MRKGFNFYRSYFEVAMELKDTEFIAFMKALLQKQFNGIEPTELKGMAKFAYLSQKHSIDSQVFGYETKTNTKLDPTVGATEPPSEQEKEKEEEKEEISKPDKSGNIDFKKLLIYFNEVTKKKCKVIPEKAKTAFNARLAEGYTKSDFATAIKNCYNDDFHKQNPQFLTLEFISRQDKLDKYLNLGVKQEEKKQMEVLY